MTNIKLNLVRHTASNTGWVHVSFYLRREKVHFSTKVQCEQKHWNERTMRVRTSDPMASDKNLILENILARINSVLVKFRLRDKMPGREAFLKAYNRPDDYETFYQFAREHQRKIARSPRGRHFAQPQHRPAQIAGICPLPSTSTTSPRSSSPPTSATSPAAWATATTRPTRTCRPSAATSRPPCARGTWKATRSGTSTSRAQRAVRLPGRGRAARTHPHLPRGELPLPKYRTLQLFLFMCFGSQHVGDARRMQLEQFNDTNFTYYRMKLKNRKPEPVTVPMSAPCGGSSARSPGSGGKGRCSSTCRPSRP